MKNKIFNRITLRGGFSGFKYSQDNLSNYKQSVGTQHRINVYATSRRRIDADATLCVLYVSCCLSIDYAKQHSTH